MFGIFKKKKREDDHSGPFMVNTVNAGLRPLDECSCTTQDVGSLCGSFEDTYYWNGPFDEQDSNQDQKPLD